MNISIALSWAAISLAAALPVAAQSSSPATHGMEGMKGMQGMHGMDKMGAMTPAQHETMMAMQHMNKAMMAANDANPDQAFAKQMIAHHEGAIAMSEIEVRMGKDADAKRLAEQTISENRQGIVKLKSFLARH